MEMLRLAGEVLIAAGLVFLILTIVKAKRNGTFEEIKELSKIRRSGYTKEHREEKRSDSYRTDVAKDNSKLMSRRAQRVLEKMEEREAKEERKSVPVIEEVAAPGRAHKKRKVPSAYIRPEQKKTHAEDATGILKKENDTAVLPPEYATSVLDREEETAVLPSKAETGVFEEGPVMAEADTAVLEEALHSEAETDVLDTEDEAETAIFEEDECSTAALDEDGEATDVLIDSEAETAVFEETEAETGLLEPEQETDILPDDVPTDLLEENM